MCAIALAGDFAPYGFIDGVRHSLDGCLHYLGVDHLSELKNINRQDIERGVWLCLRGVPERRVTEATRILLRVGKVIDELQGDWSQVSRLHPDGVRRVVRSITAEPIAALFVMGLLGADTVRPLPSGGSTVCLMRIGILSPWEPRYFNEGFKAVRHEAMGVLEHLPPEHFASAEWWGNYGCDGSRHNIGDYSCPMPMVNTCSWCPSQSLCLGLVEGLI